MYNPKRNGEKEKKKWEMIITTITLGLCIVGLIGISIISFFQTLYAFLPLNDPTMEMGGIGVGCWIAFLFALVFQYGQNAALYVRQHYAAGKRILNVFGLYDLTDRGAYMGVFLICSLIDAGTNCIWLYNQKDIAMQPIYFQIIEYGAMILIVGVEEVLGIVLQAFNHSKANLRLILLKERTDNRNERKIESPNFNYLKKENNSAVKSIPYYSGQSVAKSLSLNDFLTKKLDADGVKLHRRDKE
ncbi:MAG: hypothetical protein ABIJ40_01005 [Bacteroidota bacterium]